MERSPSYGRSSSLVGDLMAAMAATEGVSPFERWRIFVHWIISKVCDVSWGTMAERAAGSR